LARTSIPFPIVISGPSGAGKTTLAERLVAADPLLRRSISTTTRPPRPGEVEGRDYYFVSPAEFVKLKDRGELVEWAEVHHASYGTRRDFVEGQLAAGWDVLLNIDIQGGDKVKKEFPGAVMVFILPPSFADLEQRLRGRGDLAAADFASRLVTARDEIKASARYDYLVINDEIERATGDLEAIVAAERCRRQRTVPDSVRRLTD
jgi:guanylate kinase